MKIKDAVAERKQHFSIRKLTIGTTSVLLGTTLWLANSSNMAHADQADGNSDTTLVTNEVKDTETTSEQTDKTDQNQSTQSSEQVQTNGENAEAKAEVAKNVEVSATELPAQDNKISEDAVKVEDKTANTDLKKTEQESSDKSANAEKGSTQENTPVITNNKKVEETAKDDVNKTYNITITANNVASKDGKVKTSNSVWDYNFKDGVLSLKDVKDGTRIFSLGVAPTGYKLLNPEVLEQNFRMEGNTAYVNGKDANVTLKYAPISPILIKYVDEDSGEVLSSSSVGANTSSTASLEYQAGDEAAIGPSKFLAHAIDIPGYELVGDATFIDTYNNVQSLGNYNYQVVTFKYKKVMDNPNPKQEKGSGAQYGEYFGPQWSTIDPADAFNLTGAKGLTYEHDNGDVEAKVDALAKKYENQGYTYVGTFNYHYNTDYYNWNEAATSVNLVPNKDVTVKYVDQNGNELASEDILSGNPNNPDQTNNGINNKNHWYSAGEWEATPKTINGYTLRTTYGATKGKYTPYKYVVTFEYAKDTTGKVIYIDDTNNSTLKTDSLTGFVGDKIDYSTTSSIADYEKQGYVLVSDNFSADKTYQDNADENTFEVHFKHGVKPVTPETPTPEVPKTPDGKTVVNPTDLTKKVNLTVNYVNEDGTQFTGTVPANAKQTATFTGVAYVDTVTGQLVNAKQENGSWVIDESNTATPQITWTSDKTSFEGVTSPTEKGYHVTNVSDHADGTNVAAITGLTKDSGDINITVTYTKNGEEVVNKQNLPASQIVQYVDDQGNVLREEKKQTAEFTYSGDTKDTVTGEITKQGSWNETSHNFTAEEVPVIDGYVAVSGYTNNDGKYVAGGFVATNTGSNEERNKVFKVVYKKIGKIIPVGPDGKTPIPDAPTPSYHNDPTNPTAVVPNEPVPNVPGYKPSVPTVTPEKPTEDTPVVYTPDTPTPKPEEPTGPVDPVTPETPTNPTTPQTPQEPENVVPHPETPATPDTPDTPAPTPHASVDNTKKTKSTTVVPHATVAKNTEVPDSPVRTTNNPEENTLPQTGEDDTTKATVAGAAINLISLLGLSGYGKRKRRKN